MVFTVDEYDETWRRMAHPDRKVNLCDPRAARGADRACTTSPTSRTPTSRSCWRPASGARTPRTRSTAIPAWRKTDTDGALRLHPDDARRLGIADGGRARLTTKRGSVETAVEVTDTLQPGYVTLPNGMGTSYPTDDGTEHLAGVPPNELTASEDRDWLAGTPHHKHVRARVEAA